ncbi:MAG: hypothetical protein ACLP62_09425 [Acidimicrobiales bacterium]
MTHLGSPPGDHGQPDRLRSTLTRSGPARDVRACRDGWLPAAVCPTTIGATLEDNVTKGDLAVMESLTHPRACGPILPGPDPAGHGAVFTDEELTALALSADPDRPLDPDAVPLGFYLSQLPGPLPEWYMPVAATSARWWRWPVVVPVIAALLLIAGFGLCATYGQLVLA